MAADPMQVGKVFYFIQYNVRCKESLNVHGDFYALKT